MVDNTIIKVSIQTSNSYSGVKFWALKCERKDGNFNRFNLMVITMQDKGITKNLNGTRKVTEWINSKEGLAWINERKGEATSTGFGMFL